MAARAYWKGQIRLALVSIPVEIFSATKSGATIAFNQIHEPTGKRIKYEKVVPGVGPVDPDEIVKGFQVEKGNYVLLQDEEIEAVKLESKKTLELTQFVDHDEIDVLYFEKPYYVVPADDLAETLIAKKTAKFDPGKFHDRYVDALHELIDRKRKGKTIHTEEEEAPSRGANVIDLMAALKRSIERPGADEAKPKKAAAKPAAAKRAPAKKAPARKRA